jgi:assimilatory nitrate reductase catalytic subunit
MAQAAADLDLGACEDIGATDYEALAPFQWTQPKGAERREMRFFAGGGFFTPDGRARLVPVAARGGGTR